MKGYENKTLETWVVKPENDPESFTFPVGDYKLSIIYNGSLTKGIIGLYRSKYIDPRDNQTKYGT